MTRQTLATLLLILFGLTLATPVAAHGTGEALLSNAPAGPYWITVWSETVSDGDPELHLTVAVAEPGTGEEAGPVVTEATVQVTAEHPDSGARRSVAATHEGATNPLFYEAQVPLENAGIYRLTFTINGPAGAGEVQTETLIELPQPFPTTWVALAAVAIALALWGLLRRRPQP